MFEYQHSICYKCNTVVHKDSLEHADEYGDKCPNEITFLSLTPIASWGICNTASLNVFEFSKSGDAMLVAINDEKPQWYEIENCKDEEGGDEDGLSLGINFHGTSYLLNECMRCR